MEGVVTSALGHLSEYSCREANGGHLVLRKISSGDDQSQEDGSLPPNHVTLEEWREAMPVFCAVFSLCTWRRVVLSDVRGLQRDPAAWKCSSLANDQKEDRMFSVPLGSMTTSSQ